MGRVATMRQGQYSVLELALPGAPPEPAGVLLFDPSEDRLGVRLRRDWGHVASEEDAEVLEFLQDDLESKIREMGPESFLTHLEDTLSNVLRISEREAIMLGGFETALNRLYEETVAPAVLEFETHLPVYTLRAAAGNFGEQMQVEPDGWVEAPRDLKLNVDQFVATVVGRSMEPHIPDGSRCVFQLGVVGSRQGKWVLVENLEESGEGGQRYTVKRYESTKVASEDGFRHEKITMVPLNPEFDPWEIDPEAGEAERIRVIAEFIRVLD